MTTRKREYSRPDGHVDKIYPVAISELNPDGQSMLTKTKTLAFSLSAGDAAKLSVALSNAIGLLSKERKLIDLTITIREKRFTVTVR